MDLNEYTLAVLVETRLADARAAAARRRLTPRRPGMRGRLGMILIAVGRRLLASDVVARHAEPSHA